MLRVGKRGCGRRGHSSLLRKRYDTPGTVMGWWQSRTVFFFFFSFFFSFFFLCTSIFVQHHDFCMRHRQLVLLCAFPLEHGSWSGRNGNGRDMTRRRRCLFYFIFSPSLPRFLRVHGEMGCLGITQPLLLHPRCVLPFFDSSPSILKRLMANAKGHFPYTHRQGHAAGGRLAERDLWSWHGRVVAGLR